MEKIVEQGLLYDFYGELLTEHQKKLYEAAVYEDFSLSEIAQEAGISRQGVHDLLRRCDKILAEYEQKLHLVEKFARIKGRVEQLQKMAGEAGPVEQNMPEPAFRREVYRLAGEILEEL